VEFTAYRLFVGVLNMVPERVALLLGEGVGWAAGIIFRIRWRVVDEHLRLAFPERDRRWRHTLIRRSFRHMGREAVSTFRLGSMDREEVRRRTEVVGFDEVRKVSARGKGLIVISGHFGNWEIGGASIAVHGVPVEVVAQRQRNPLFDAELVANRNRLGMEVIERKEAPKKVLRALRSGKAVGIVGDQNVRRGGVFVDFFGRPAATARGTALFALRTGAPIFLGMATRIPGVPQRYRVTFEPIDFTPSGDMDQDVLRLTETHTKHLEEHVRGAPEQYFWQHRRWKTRPPGEVPPEAGRRTGGRK
jgi:KDO2-lipid IV(A) lauroyltransferase